MKKQKPRENPIKLKKVVFTKSDRIRHLFDKGRSIVEIAKILDAHYSFVHTVVRKHKPLTKKKR